MFILQFYFYHLRSVGPGSKLDLAVLFVEGEPSVVHVAGGCDQVRWDPVDGARTCHNQLKNGINMK